MTSLDSKSVLMINVDFMGSELVDVLVGIGGGSLFEEFNSSRGS